MFRSRLALTVAAIVCCLVAFDATAQGRPDPDSPRYKGVLALEEFVASEGDEALAAFADDHIAVAWREELGDEHLFMMLAGIRDEFAGVTSNGARPTGPLGATIMFPGDDGPRSLSFTLDADDTARFTSIDLNS